MSKYPSSRGHPVEKTINPQLEQQLEQIFTLQNKLENYTVYTVTQGALQNILKRLTISETIRYIHGYFAKYG